MATRTPATKCCANAVRGQVSIRRRAIFFMSAPLRGDSRTLAWPDGGPACRRQRLGSEQSYTPTTGYIVLRLLHQIFILDGEARPLEPPRLGSKLLRLGLQPTACST